jgi:hypothetical protein
MLDITFDKFKQLPEFKNLTLKELSVLICGTERLYGFLSKLATHYPVSVAYNFAEVATFVATHGYNLILDNDYNNTLSLKDKKIKELEAQLDACHNIIDILTTKLDAYIHFEQALELMNSLKQNERLYKRPKHNKNF